MAVENVPGSDAEVRIAAMGLRDIPQVAGIERQSYPAPWSARAFVTEITENVCACYLVARVGATVVGYAGIWVLLDEAHVTNIAVHPAWRRRGIATRLLLELIWRARVRGASRMTLEVRPSNEAALQLYERFGFEARGRRRGYYTDTREDALIMWKDDLTDLPTGEPG